MTAFIITLCGFLPFPILIALKVGGLLDTWLDEGTDVLALAVLTGYGCMLLMLIAAVLAIVGICRKKQRGWNIAALLLMVAWPLVCGLLQCLFC